MYKYSQERYGTILGTILAQAGDIATAAEIISQLPVLCSEVWEYLGQCFDQIDIQTFQRFHLDPFMKSL